MNKIRLTEYSHGAGCGCKLSPGVLSEILGNGSEMPHFPNLLVGNETKDDAAVFNLDGKTAIISTTDFFMPIVDDPFDFGAIAATNAISDIYAMGGKPLMAIAILGWPIDKLSPEIAGQVLEGGKSVCHAAGIPLAGGHSIDCPEPIFGLAVTGSVSVENVKKNNTAKEGDYIFLTKPLGIGLVTTAQKRQLAKEIDLIQAKQSMMTLNKIGEELTKLPYVNAVTDVTGFGLAGHLLEVCEGSELSAELWVDQIPLFPFVNTYLELDCIPGGTVRNWKTYGHKMMLNRQDDYKILCDPQTSGGLLITVPESQVKHFADFLKSMGIDENKPIGKFKSLNGNVSISSR